MLAAALLRLGGLPTGILLGLVSAFPALMAARRVLRHHARTAAIIPAQGQALLAFLPYAIGAGAGALL